MAFSVGEKNCLTPVTNYATVVDVEAKMDNAKTEDDGREVVTLAELTKRVERLHRLLQNPEPGLMTWNAMVGHALAAVTRVA